MASPESLETWLSRLVAAPAERIELGLARVDAVHDRLGRPRPAPIVITVGGTNGKGSTVAFLAAMLRAAGYRVGSYTSPHLFRFNERIVVDGAEAADASIIDAFRRIDAARGDTRLTFFEYATLAAFLMFAEADLDVAVLEVGLGGRLDAVNLVDADVAIVTTVDLDHQHYLGDTREAIAIEKAGIFRAGRPAVVAESEPAASLLAEIARIGAHPLRLGQEYRIDVDREDWHWIGAGTSLRLPHPGLRAPVQHYNAAAAIAALWPCATACMCRSAPCASAWARPACAVASRSSRARSRRYSMSATTRRPRRCWPTGCGAIRGAPVRCSRPWPTRISPASSNRCCRG